jgi:hypothetical protein
MEAGSSSAGTLPIGLEKASQHPSFKVFTSTQATPFWTRHETETQKTMLLASRRGGIATTTR